MNVPLIQHLSNAFIKFIIQTIRYQNKKQKNDISSVILSKAIVKCSALTQPQKKPHRRVICDVTSRPDGPQHYQAEYIKLSRSLFRTCSTK